MSLSNGASAPVNRVRRLAVAGVLVAALLGGCSDDDAGTPPTGGASPSALSTPDASASASASAEPTPDVPVIEPPVKTAEMDGQDAAAAVAAAAYFLELYTYTYQSGDLTLWQEVSDPSCILCASVVTNVEAMVAAGETYEGGEITWTEGPVAALLPGTDAHEVQISATQEAGRTRGADGVVVGSFAAKPLPVVMFVYKEPNWMIFDITVTP